MMFYVVYALFILYNIVVFWYASYVYHIVSRKKWIYWLTALINGTFFVGAFHHAAIFHESVLMLVYLLVVILEFKLIYHEKWMNVLFGVFCFALNFFAIRLLYTSILAMNRNLSIAQVMGDQRLTMVIMIFVFLTTIPYITMFRLFFPQNYMNMLLVDRNNLTFATTIVASIYLYLMVNTKNLYFTEMMEMQWWLQLKIGICAIFGFGAAMVYAYLFAKQQLYVVEVKEIKSELELDQKQLEQLENDLNFDAFTQCYRRNFGEQRLQLLLKKGKRFSVAYFDLDGLKTANDQYGHHEGDWYIKAVADILKSHSNGHPVCRMGGDEFLMILADTDSYTAMRLAVQCFDQIQKLKEEYQKPFFTSVSYGVMEVAAFSHLTVEDILKEVDQKMYSFKRSRKKNRILRIWE